MPSEITMPQLSDTMSEGTLVKWSRKEGDKVKAGDELAEVETDKATMPMEAFDSGTLAYIAAAEGQKVKVGELLGVLALAGEDPAQIKKQYQSGKPKAQGHGQEPAAAEAPRPAQAQVQEQGAEPAPQRQEAQPAQTEGTARPARQPVAAAAGASSHDTELGHEPLEAGRAQSRREIVGTGPERTAEAIAAEAAALMNKTRREKGDGKEDRAHASPVARRVAQQMGVDLAKVRGSGPNGRIVEDDVRAYAQHPPKPAPPPSSVEGQPARQTIPKPEAQTLEPRISDGAKEIVTLSKIRSIIAQRLQASKQTIPHFYETMDIDVEELSALRARLNKAMEKEGLRLSLADLIVKGLSAALKAVPAMNANFDGKEITRFGDINLGIAVALPEGLIVPVLRGVNYMGLREIRVKSADLIDRARQLRLKQEELTGATFTISNLGAYGVRDFSAIINPPEVAILAIASADKRPVVRDDQVISRTILSVTASCDHRVVDGATCAAFLRTLKQILEEPGMMLV